MSNHAKKLKTKYNFKPSFKLSIITLLLSFILVYLGTWQMARATEKKNILLNIEKKINLAPVNLETIVNPALSKDRFTKIKIKGTLLNHYTFLLDNQLLDHKVGFRILTPVQTPKLNKWIMVDRGWLPINTKRSVLPKIDDLDDAQEIVGTINNISSGLILKKDVVDLDASWPLIIQTIDYEFIAQQLQHPVFDFVLQLNSTNINVGISSSKHLGYAIQWFFFAVILLIYFLMASIKKDGA